MEAIAEGLWGLADIHEQKGDIGKAVKCLEAICQSHVTFLPIVEIKTRLRIASLLLNHSNNISHATSHLERSQLLLKSIPSCFELKCRACSLLSQCYHLVGAIPQQKQILYKGLELTKSSGNEMAMKFWFCNFSSQLANALVIEGDYQTSVVSLERGFECATELCQPELQVFFATSVLHVHLVQWDDVDLVEKAVNRCTEIWETILPDEREKYLGLLFYYELLQVFYLLRICDYKSAAQHVEKLDASVKADMLHDVSYPGNLGLCWDTKIKLAPPPIDGEWLSRSAIHAMVDLMAVIVGRPKGNFKDCGKRIQSGMQTIQGELAKLGITYGSREMELQHSAIWVAGVYLMLLMQFLENKVAVDLTRSEFIEAQEALVQMTNWYTRFPTILQACGCIIEMLRGQYSHSVGCFTEAVFHYMEAAKLTESKSMQGLCHLYAAVSYICIGDAESSSQALDIIGPIFRIMDSFVGVREKTCVLLAYGVLLMKQHNLQEARIRLATGLQMTHNHLGNLQLVSQYLTILGSLALALHDTVQAREILRSSLTLAKKLYDIPTQVWVLSVLTALYQELGEKGNELENIGYQSKKVDELRKRLAEAHSSIHHIKLVDRVKVEVQELHDTGRDIAVPSIIGNFDIPESVGLSTSLPSVPSRLLDFETGRRGKRKM